MLPLERDGELDFVKALDFGLAKDVSGKGEDLTQTRLCHGLAEVHGAGAGVGRRRSLALDRRLRLGVMLYELLTGAVTVRSQGRDEHLFIAHVNEAPLAA